MEKRNGDSIEIELRIPEISIFQMDGRPISSYGGSRSTRRT